MARKRRRRGGSAADAFAVAVVAYVAAFGVLGVERLAAVCAVGALVLFGYTRWWGAVWRDRVRAFKRRHRVVIESAPSLLLAAAVGVGLLWWVVEPVADVAVVAVAVAVVGRALWRERLRRAGARRRPRRKRRPRSR